ncbi:MAG: branched-chain amino acid ABC transporter substrate-binding protein [Chloroflexi bacterium]|nr:branched-chain amino acid ABC transporter substrate-binding protein [Chloroflexota bacterium]
MTKAFALLTLILVLFSFPSCLSSGTSRVVKIGLVAPFSGRDASLGYGMLIATRLAIREWNEAGGVRGYPIELVAHDDGNDGDRGRRQAQKMAIDPDVVAVLGHPSNASALAAADEYRRAGLAMISLGATVGGMTASGSPGVFRFNAADELLAREVARFAADFLKARRLALLVEESPSYLPLADGAEKEARGRGLSVVLRQVVSPLQSDYAYVVEALREASPDLVFFSGHFVQGGAMIAQLRRGGIAAPLLGGPWLDTPDLLKIAGEGSAGTYYLSLSPMPQDVPGTGSFISRFKSLAGIEPRNYDLMAYEAANRLLRAVQEDAGPNIERSSIVGSLMRGSYKGISGVVVFDGKGERLDPRVEVRQIRDMAYPGQRLW